MKGLLYKDFVLNKANIVAMAFIIFYLVIELITAYFMPESDEFVFFANATMIGGIISLQGLFPIIAMDAGRVDAGSKWIQYALALPGGYRYMVFERYLLGWLGNVLALVLDFIMVGIVKLVFRIDIKVPIMLMLLLLGSMLIVQAFAMLLISRGKTGIAGKTFVIVIFLAFLGGLCYIAFGDFSGFSGKHLFARIAMWLLAHEKRVWLVLSGLIGAGVIMEYLSYRLAVNLYKKD